MRKPSPETQLRVVGLFESAHPLSHLTSGGGFASVRKWTICRKHGPHTIPAPSTGICARVALPALTHGAGSPLILTGSRRPDKSQSSANAAGIYRMRNYRPKKANGWRRHDQPRPLRARTASHRGHRRRLSGLSRTGLIAQEEGVPVVE